MTRLFLYGTLKRGGVSAHLLAGQRFLGEARTRAAFRLYGLGGFPGMVPAAAGGRAIEGELWEVDAECLARLDRWEGLDEGLYVREPVPLLPPHDGAGAQAYLYCRSVAGKKDLGARFEARVR
ncbi:MAG TPA: gamma-glutamylcyclotransferase family protein [Opitutaceae bacterium]|nr:gamma-glutamylcyclotransferase family protein [Opitutaceae bacterium]